LPEGGALGFAGWFNRMTFSKPTMQRLDLVGEDTSDLLRAIEREFGITFNADEIVQATTVGKLAECVSKKVELPAIDRCLSAVVFYTLPRAFVSLVNIPRTGVVPRTPSANCFPGVFGDRVGVKYRAVRS